MKIYLDNCVIQDLKRSENSDLYALIKVDKENNIYCYSEAHLQDLMRDKSQEKFKDLKFMESIVGQNCWHYNEKILFDHISPKDFYDPFPTYSENLLDVDELFSSSLILQSVLNIFKSIPLNFNLFIKPNSLPTDFPEQFSKLLEEPTNFYDFFCAFGNFTNELSANQNKFKELVSYLHNNNLSVSIFEYLGIEGYDGKKITDKDKFRESYTKYFIKGKTKKDIYDLFLKQYNGLEFFSLVKGIPRKQKMMNMINDGRHAFFGGFCDIVVSKDADFIEKTKFMYEMHNIETLVLNIAEFRFFLNNSKFNSKMNLMDMLKDGNTIKEESIIQNENGILLMLLEKTYFSYFNCVNYISNEHGIYAYYTRIQETMSTFTLKNELERLVELLTETLGIDANGKNKFTMSEIKEGNWGGRIWRVMDTVIKLNINEKVYLAFYPIDYLKA
jgi:hypothetical protein